MRSEQFATCLLLTLAAQYGVAQDATRNTALSGACFDFNRTVLNQLARGAIRDAGNAVSEAISGGNRNLEQSCAWVAQYNMAFVMSQSGRLAQAETFAEQSVRILEITYPPDHVVLLRPLEMLAAIQFKQGRIGKARETFRRMQAIRIELPADHALIRTAAAGLLVAEGRYGEAEQEYLAALAAWNECGLGDSMDAAAMLDGLASLYVLDGRHQEAGPLLDRAIAIVASVKDVLPLDRIKLLNARAVLYARQGEWRRAEDKLRSAISVSDTEMGLDPPELEVVLRNYAHVLHKNHRDREASSIEERVTAVRLARGNGNVVDVSELLARPKARKR